MGSNYTPVSYILNLASAEMMKHYKIPHCGTSGSNNGRGADLIADGNLWLNHLTACLGKVGCSPFVGGNFGSMAFSPATVVLSNQIIAEARQFAAGFTISEKTVNVEEINHVGHGGNFFTSEQTLESIQSLGDLPEIWPSMSLAAWKEQQQPTAQEALTDHAKTLYTKAISESEEHMEIVKRGEAFIRNSLI
jgi:trimethylamine--corrinoid protein Co-methyltransferase